MYLSAIIPCYNVDKKLIERCLASILKQTYSDYEIIMVDDGSDKVHREILTDAAQLDSRIRLIRQENRGVSAARNTGVTQAVGEYVTFIDADDVLTASFFEEAVSTAKTCAADIVMGMNRTTYSMDTEPSETDRSHKVRVFEHDQIKDIKKWMLGRVYGHLEGTYLGQGPWNRLIRRQLAIDTLFDERFPIGEDIVWNLQLLKKADKVCIVDSVWYIYYVNPTSSSRKYRENAIKESYDSLEEIAKHLDLDDDEQYVSYCYRCWGDLKRIYHCYLCYQGKKAAKQKKDLFNHAPWNVLSSKRFKKLCDFKHCFMRYLYVTRLVFVFYRSKRMIGQVLHKSKS